MKAAYVALAGAPPVTQLMSDSEPYDDVIGDMVIFQSGCKAPLPSKILEVFKKAEKGGCCCNGGERGRLRRIEAVAKEQEKYLTEFFFKAACAFIDKLNTAGSNEEGEELVSFPSLVTTATNTSGSSINESLPSTQETTTIRAEEFSLEEAVVKIESTTKLRATTILNKWGYINKGIVEWCGENRTSTFLKPLYEALCYVAGKVIFQDITHEGLKKYIGDLIGVSIEVVEVTKRKQSLPDDDTSALNSLMVGTPNTTNIPLMPQPTMTASTSASVSHVASVDPGEADQDENLSIATRVTRSLPSSGTQTPLGREGAVSPMNSVVSVQLSEDEYQRYLAIINYKNKKT